MSENHSIRGHAKLGGSTAERWTNCPGSILLSVGIEPEPPSPKALEGTAAHEISEMLLSDFIDHKLHGTDPSIRAHILSTNPEYFEAAEGYRNSIWKEVLEHSITNKAYGIEEKLVLDEQLGMYGFVDFWCVYIDDRGKRTGVVVDFKYGYNYVDAEKNAQLAYYACGLREEIRQGGKDLDRVRAAIFQPRYYNSSISDKGTGGVSGDSGRTPGYREVSFTSKQLDAWKKKFFDAAYQIYVKQKPKYKVGKWCHFCPAQGICQTYRKDLQKKTSLKFVDPEEEMALTISQVSDEAIVNVIRNESNITKLIKECKKYALRKAISGTPLKGIKCVKGPTRRKWGKDEARIATSLKECGVEEPCVPKLRGITEIEKELARSHGKEDAKAILNRICEMTSTNFILVPENDPRPAIASANELYLPLDDDEHSIGDEYE